jgi:hypothetical protein
MLFLMCMPCLILVYIYLAIHFMIADCGVHKSLVKTAVHFVPCQPFICWTIANGAMHSTWVLCLWVMQMKQIASDLTTNEAMNQYRCVVPQQPRVHRALALRSRARKRMLARSLTNSAARRAHLHCAHMLAFSQPPLPHAARTNVAGGHILVRSLNLTARTPHAPTLCHP